MHSLRYIDRTIYKYMQFAHLNTSYNAYSKHTCSHIQTSYNVFIINTYIPHNTLIDVFATNEVY